MLMPIDEWDSYCGWGEDDDWFDDGGPEQPDDWRDEADDPEAPLN